MKRTMLQRVLALVLSATLLFSVFIVTASAGDKKGTDTQSDIEKIAALLDSSKYADYIVKNADKMKEGLTEKTIDVVAALVDSESNKGVKTSDSDYYKAAVLADAAAWSEFGDRAATSVYSPATGSVSWTIDVSDSEAGLYFIRFDIFSCITGESSVSAIERKLYIDGAIPFTEASNLTFGKTWKYDNIETYARTTEDLGISYERTKDAYFKYYVTDTTVTKYTISQDINGNSMAPESEQVASWKSSYCVDSTGYTEGYFAFYFPAGTHTLTLEAKREPMIVGGITLVPADDATARIPSFEEVKAAWTNAGYQSADGGSIVNIQTEFPDYVSDASVTMTNDNTSSATYPASAKSQLFNVIGENSYNTVGQWAAYKFKVDKSGLYKFGMRYKQNALEGMYICRTIKLSGGAYGDNPVVPYKEAYDAQFNFSKDWQSSYLGDSQGNVFEFYFEEGKEYTVYLECSLGSLKDLISRVEAALAEINADYLRILQLTGASADEYREYNFQKVMPEVLVSLLKQAINLTEIADEFEALCGTKGSHVATLDTIANLLDRMGSNNGYEIAANMANLKSYLGTLGTWINNSKRTSMIVDAMIVAPASSDAKVLKDNIRANKNFFASAWFEISSFFYSFFVNYDAMGLTSIPDKDTPTIEVWLATGRDQSQIWRTMIDAKDGFTDKTGTAVTLKLVTAGTLLPSILSGKGPDVYMGLGSADVINYAIREAVLGINGLDKRLSEKENSYFTSTYYTYKNADGTYAEPTTTPRAGEEASFVSKPYSAIESEFVPAAKNTLTLLGVTYGLPMTMSMAMMFYRSDILADLGVYVPETWDELLALLPEFQANNMSIGVAYASAINVLLYQMGGNMWKYTENDEYAGARIGLDTNVAFEAFDYVCRLYTEYSFPVTYDGANRFRTGEMPILVGDYVGIYNQNVVFATELEGLWEFCSLPGWERDDGVYCYDSLAGVGATVLLHGCDNMLAAWEFMQWQTSAEIQANYGNKMVALIGPSAKYETANINAIRNLSWSASERAAIEDQIEHLSSVVNYPGSYIIDRYTKFAFLNAYNDGADPVDAIRQYIDAINSEIKRKRDEFDLKTPEDGKDPDYLVN